MFADTKGMTYLAEEDSVSHELALMPSIPQLAIIVAEKVTREEKRGQQFSIRYDLLSPNYVVVNQPTAVCRSLNHSEKEMFEEWYNARKQFIKLRDDYGF